MSVNRSPKLLMTLHSLRLIREDAWLAWSIYIPTEKLDRVPHALNQGLEYCNQYRYQPITYGIGIDNTGHIASTTLEISIIANWNQQCWKYHISNIGNILSKTKILSKKKSNIGNTSNIEPILYGISHIKYHNICTTISDMLYAIYSRINRYL